MKPGLGASGTAAPGARRRRPGKTSAAATTGWRLLSLVLLCGLSLQLYFVVRIALMAVLAPQSTTFQRSEAWRLLVDQRQIAWSQTWVDGERISVNLKRAVIASEDAGFVEHDGVDWDALEKAWEKNQRAEAVAERRNAQLEKMQQQQQQRPSQKPAQNPAHPAPDRSNKPAAAAHRTVEPKVVGGSTISQQLAKNLFLSGERTVFRKAQEFLLTLALEALLDKRRILEIYLNSVEWGEGVFGAQAAARHYFRTDAARLDAYAAARLAVMLPAPKRFEKNPGSAYLGGRAATIVARMGAVALP
jgi:monofunctional glycosyltransferase